MHACVIGIKILLGTAKKCTKVNSSSCEGSDLKKKIDLSQKLANSGL